MTRSNSTNGHSTRRYWLIRRLGLAATYGVVVGGALTMVFPYLWLVINSLKTADEFGRNPYSLIPHPIDFEAYVRAFTLGRVGVYLFNSLIYAIVGTVVQLLFD